MVDILHESWTVDPQLIVDRCREVSGRSLQATIIEKHGRRGCTVTIPGIGMLAEAFPCNRTDWEIALWAIPPLANESTTTLALEAFRAMDLPASLTTVVSPHGEYAAGPASGDVDLDAVTNVLAAFTTVRMFAHSTDFGSSASR